MRLLALVALIALGCAPASGDEDHWPRVWLTSGGKRTCGGVRVEPDLVLTAKHCGLALSLDGAPCTVVGVYPQDIEALHCRPGGAYVGTAPFALESSLTLVLQGGPVRAQVTDGYGATLVLDHPCQHGDSGSPVLSDAGVVAIVSWTDGVHCGVERTEYP